MIPSVLKQLTKNVPPPDPTIPFPDRDALPNFVAIEKAYPIWINSREIVTQLIPGRLQFLKPIPGDDNLAIDFTWLDKIGSRAPLEIHDELGTAVNNAMRYFIDNIPATVFTAVNDANSTVPVHIRGNAAIDTVNSSWKAAGFGTMLDVFRHFLGIEDLNPRHTITISTSL